MNVNNVGHGSLLSYLLAYGWGILIFLALIGSVGVGLYWIFTALWAKISKESGTKRAKTIAWSVGIIGAILITSMGLLIPFGPK